MKSRLLSPSDAAGQTRMFPSSPTNIRVALIVGREERAAYPKRRSFPAYRADEGRSRAKLKNIGRDVRAIYGGCPFADVRRGLRMVRAGILPRIKQPVQVTPTNFCRFTKATGSLLFQSLVKFCQEPASGFTNRFEALCSAVAHVEQRSERNFRDVRKGFGENRNA